jgi:hypothetical protein
LVHNIAKHYSPSGFREMVQQYIEQACSNTNRVSKQSEHHRRLPSR